MSYKLIKPLLFSLSPEAAHDLTVGSLALPGSRALLRPLSGFTVCDPIKLMGLTFPNRVGLAAGLDKDATSVSGLQGLGFGFLEVGTVTPKPQPGNPKPRMFRLPEHDAIINRMGFNNEGLAALVARVTTLRRSSRLKVPLGINIGKNKDTPPDKAVDDYLKCLREVCNLADYVTVNLSSPNTPGLRDLQFGDALDQLLDQLCEERARLLQGGLRQENRLPMLIKLAPDMADEDLVAVAESARTMGIDGLIVSNTTVDRSAVAGHRYESEAGGLSGSPLFEKSTHALKTVADALQLRKGDPEGIKANQQHAKDTVSDDKKFVLIGVGGVDSGERAAAKIDAGADLVQLYSGLVYKGPGLVKEAARAIKRHARS